MFWLLPIITIFMKGAPRSAQFDDIYFSAENGLEETAHVFLRGNNLPQVWEGRADFTIAETGFGTGLNFLSVWKLFEETAASWQSLDFISVEKYPLTPDEIRQALLPWADYFGLRIENLLAQYPIRIAGFHRIKINKQITLTLIFDDIGKALPAVTSVVDCWFLDGFTPAKNPEMWSVQVFEQMARLSAVGASYATFTAAGDVRRGLTAAGFSVEKQKGFGRKRDMCAGKFLQEGSVRPKPLKRGARVAVIGGGLAGTSCAYVLKQYGYEPVIYEKGNTLGSGASGNQFGLYNPRFSKLRDEFSDFFSPAYAQVIRTLKQAGDEVEYNPCGALHLMYSKDRADRFSSMVQNWQWSSDHARIVSIREASDLAGIALDCEALYLPDAGSVSPQKLCAYYAEGIDVRLNAQIDDLTGIDADAVILACGAAVQNFDPLSWLSIQSVRGQISALQETDKSKLVKCNLCYSGYLSPSKSGVHMAGSTFDRNSTDISVSASDHGENIAMLKEDIGSLSSEEFSAVSGRAALRAATNDRFPIVGKVPDSKNIYVSAAFGSHGLVGSIAASHLIADVIRCGTYSLSRATTNILASQRFLDRLKKRSGN